MLLHKVISPCLGVCLTALSLLYSNTSNRFTPSKESTICCSGDHITFSSRCLVLNRWTLEIRGCFVCQARVAFTSGARSACWPSKPGRTASVVTQTKRSSRSPSTTWRQYRTSSVSRAQSKKQYRCVPSLLSTLFFDPPVWLGWLLLFHLPYHELDGGWEVFMCWSSE